jgi:hypothetical protein
VENTALQLAGMATLMWFSHVGGRFEWFHARSRGEFRPIRVLTVRIAHFFGLISWCNAVIWSANLSLVPYISLGNRVHRLD